MTPIQVQTSYDGKSESMSVNRSAISRPSGEMKAPQIPVRLNRAESLRRIHALNVDASGNQPQLSKGEVGSFVIGKNKLAAQNLRKQTGRWFRQRNLMVDKIERHQRAAYEKLLRLAREKTVIREQMQKTNEGRLCDSESEKPHRNETEEKEVGSSSNSDGDEHQEGDAEGKKLHPRPDGGFGLTTEVSSRPTDTIPRTFTFPKPPQSAPTQSARMRPDESDCRKPRHRISVPAFPTTGDLVSGQLEEKLPSVHERYRKMFEKIPQRNTNTSGSTALPSIGQHDHQNHNSDSPMKDQPQRYQLLRLLEDQKTTDEVVGQATARMDWNKNDTISTRLSGDDATVPPCERRKQILNGEEVVLYKVDHDGNIVPEHFPYRRRRFALPKEKDEAFYKKLIEREEKSKKKSQQRFSDLFDEDLGKLDERNPLLYLRRTDHEDEDKIDPDKYAKLGTSLSHLVRAFRQEWRALKGLDPNSMEALRLCRYLRLKQAQERRSSVTSTFEAKPTIGSLERHVTWLA